MRCILKATLLIVGVVASCMPAAMGQQAHIGANSYPTIQQAITAATAGATITLDAGIFIGNVIINKPLTIKGAGQGLTVVLPSVSNPNCNGLGGGSICGGGSNVMLVQAHNVTITDLTIDGDNPALTSNIVRSSADIDARNGIITNHGAGVFNNLKVMNVTVKNIYLRGIYASSGGTFVFSNNTVQNVNGEYASIGMMNYNGAGLFLNNTVTDCNDAIASNWSKGSRYSGNVVSNSGSGIHSDNNQVLADVIEDNTVMNGTTYGYGIWVFSPYVPVVVNRNTITNVYAGLTNAGQAVATTPVFSNNIVDGNGRADAIGVYQTTDRFGFGTTNVSGVFQNNTITNTGYAFYNEFQAGKTNSITVTNNAITSNINDVVNGTAATGAGTLVNNFSCNWWGTNDPAFTGKSSAGINSAPWLTSGADGNASPGFQPLAACNGTLADNDGDGLANNSDCEPFNPAAGNANTYYADADGDGFGNPAVTTQSCSTLPPAGYVGNNNDCNDNQWTYADNDNDGFGYGANTACGVANNFDSNDGDGKPLVFVCHKANNIVINANALQGHLGHGDLAGKCSGNTTSKTSTQELVEQPVIIRAAPNPFTNEIQIRYQLPGAGNVAITMYDMMGRKVASLYAGDAGAGDHSLKYNGDLHPGSYFCRIVFTAGDHQQTQTIKLVKTSH